MCGDQSEETFFTIHHEMGHVQYYMNYAKLPTIFRVRQLYFIRSPDCINLVPPPRMGPILRFMKQSATPSITEFTRQRT